MSKPAETKQYVRFIRPDKNINDMTFEDKKEEERQKSKSAKNMRDHSKSPSSVSKSHMKTKTLKDEICELLSSAKFAKQKINKGLQFVKLVDNFNQDQRCLEHNNVITLYCMHDKKLLCVYCIYGVNKHRSHKLLPPFEHLEFIAKDVHDLQQDFNQFLFSLEDVVSNSKLTCELFQNIMKKYLGQIQSEYVKRKFQLQQLYQSLKKYVTKVCEELIENSKLISNEYEEIKFNIWQCQARYNLDKKLKIGNQNQKQANFLQKQPNQKNTKFKQNKQAQTQGALANKGKSPLKPGIKNLKNDTPQKQIRKQEIKAESVDQNGKDYREVLSKHIILNHIVEQMRKIQPIKIDEKAIERKIFNRSMLKFISHIYSDSDKSPLKRDPRSNLSINRQM